MEAQSSFHDLRAEDDAQQIQNQPLMETASLERPVTEVQPSSEDYGHRTGLLFIGVSLCALIIFLLRHLQFRKKLQNYLNSSLFSPSVKCSKCRFFSRNPHLKCAVHPHQVNRIDATECPDFWPDDQSEFYGK